jgi:hypothetical protein
MLNITLKIDADLFCNGYVEALPEFNEMGKEIKELENKISASLSPNIISGLEKLPLNLSVHWSLDTKSIYFVNVPKKYYKNIPKEMAHSPKNIDSVMSVPLSQPVYWPVGVLTVDFNTLLDEDKEDIIKLWTLRGRRWRFFVSARKELEDKINELNEMYFDSVEEQIEALKNMFEGADLKPSKIFLNSNTIYYNLR